MNLNDPIPELDQAGLKHFAYTTGALFVIIFALILPFLLGFDMPRWPWAILIVLGLMALIYPSSLRPVYRGWMRFSMLLGWLNSRLILGLFFYTFIVPTGLLFRLLGKEIMPKSIDKAATSYRIISKQPNNEKMQRPF